MTFVVARASLGLRLLCCLSLCDRLLPPGVLVVLHLPRADADGLSLFYARNRFPRGLPALEGDVHKEFFMPVDVDVYLFACLPRNALSCPPFFFDWADQSIAAGTAGERVDARRNAAFPAQVPRKVRGRLATVAGKVPRIRSWCLRIRWRARSLTRSLFMAFAPCLAAII